MPGCRKPNEHVPTKPAATHGTELSEVRGLGMPAVCDARQLASVGLCYSALNISNWWIAVSFSRRENYPATCLLRAIEGARARPQPRLGHAKRWYAAAACR